MDQRKAEALDRLLVIMERLRAECPWDREQTFLSLRNNTIEEAYELTEAIETGNMAEIRKELGDVLLHIVFYSLMAQEQGAFDIADVANSLCDKLIYRHPHVFGDVAAEDAGTVTRNWEQLKLHEKDRPKGVLSGVPRSMPAMTKAYRLSQKAASAGFDWPSKEAVWEKVREEIGELEAEMRGGDSTQGQVAESVLRAAASRPLQPSPVRSPLPAEAGTVSGSFEALEGEMGDVFFALVNAARLYGIDPELALERCNKKFIRRFQYIEARTADEGRELRDLTPGQWEELWQEAKITDKQ